MFSRAEKTWLAEWWWSIDRELLGALIMLLACGMVLSFGASPAVAERIGLDEWHFVIRHAMFCVLAVPVMLATSLLSHRQARLSALFVLVVMTVLLWATLYFGTEVKGARRWVSLAGQSIQPSEFVKPAFAVISAWLFSESLIHRNVPGRWMAAGLMVLIVAALLLQPDVGQTALVVATWAVLLFFSGISWWVIIGLGLLAVSALAGAYMFFPHVSRRIDTFINPDAGGNTYQIDRAIQSLLEGGWFGRGPGESLAKKLIPDAHADYVFSAAAGEFGILFCMGLVGLIAFIVIRAMISAQRQTSLFARLAASTIAVQFAMQSGINLAVNLNLIPPKGMTLPFVSYGGTSMFAVAFGMGLMLALTRTKPEERMATGIPSYRSAVVAPAE
ncbi:MULTISPECIES: putative peptidoglycan glycosyltransferase FtsW [unclassified Devosia]|uniref:FtsW/RodA/SpoVE family cell cycle protein n=1 Tax=unclassified Devosia TaxID=196773 RepID=UPI00145F40D2|nr:MULTISPECIES: putative peptidoglycan glycosyltransferase FtsW [unclassified Devosia]MBK1793756.1 cell division protein FtsW [Devosia sp. WQ 349K1]